jgi:phosphopantetheinyl transferase (holo-ACP synthase)
MLGNDVVDLRDPESGPERRHPRFDARVFDDVERAMLAPGAEGERRRWWLWAAKESAYKAARKEDPRTVFAPRRFVVRPADRGLALVRVGDRDFQVEVQSDGEHVHAVARRAGDPGTMVWAAAAALSPSDATASVAVRQFAVATLAARLGVAPDDLAIRSEGRIPVLWQRGRRTAADLSLSHHGRFVAFCCCGDVPCDL